MKTDKVMGCIVVLMLATVIVMAIGCGSGGGGGGNSTTPPSVDTTPPGDVSNLSASAYITGVMLTWTDPSDSDLNKILILRNTTETFTTPTNGVTYSDGTNTGAGAVWCKNVSKGIGTYIDTTVTDSTSYFYKVYSYDANMNYSSGYTAIVITSNTISSEKTKVLDTTTTQSISSVSGDGRTLTFSQSTPMLQSLSTGDVIVSDVTSSTPDGFLGIVSSITQNGTQVVVNTTSATLEDALKCGTIEFTEMLTPDEVSSSVTLKKGILFESVDNNLPNALSNQFSILARDVVLYDHDGKSSTTSDQIRANGSITLEPGFTFDLKIDDFQLNEMFFTGTAVETVELELTTGNFLSISDIVNTEVEIAKYYFKPITISIGGVPVVIIPVLTINLGFDGTVTAGIETSVNQQATFTAGLSYKNGTWSPISSFTNTFDYTLPTLYGGFVAKGYASSKLKLLIYGVTGPTGELAGYMELDADVLRVPWWELYAGLECNIGIEVEVLSHVVAGYEATVIDYKKLLTQAQTSSDTTPPSDVSSLSASAGNGQVTLTWTDPLDSDLNRILILQNTTGIFSIPADGVIYPDGANTGPDSSWCKNISKNAGLYTDTGLTNSTTYYYKLHTYDTSMNYSSPGKSTSATPSSGVSSSISLSTTTLSPSCYQGANATSQTFTIRNSGSGTLSYSISDNASWIDCSPANGISTGESDTITVNYSTSTLSPDTYTGTITVSASGASNTPQTISVTLTVSQQGDWSFETIDSSLYAGQYSSVVIDSSNNVHIVYYEGWDSIIWHITKTSGVWSGKEQIVSVSNAVPERISMAIDSNNKIHICYYDNHKLKYATNKSGAWVSEIVVTRDVASSYDNANSIATDSNGKVYISYNDGANQQVRYATNTSGTWTDTIVESVGEGGAGTSIKIDSNNKLHLVYASILVGIRYATNISGILQKYTVDSPSGCIYRDVSMVLDSNNVHIAYFDEQNNKLKYVTNTNGTWDNKETVESQDNVGWGVVLAVDSQKKAHITYEDLNIYPAGKLKYATNKNSSWLPEVVDSSSGRNPAIAVDSNGTIHVSYYDYINSHLKYAMKTSSQGVGPEIKVTGKNGTEIFNGDTTPSITDGTDLGSVMISGGTSLSGFHVNNTGTAELILSGSSKVSITGLNANDFTVTIEPESPVEPGGITAFAIQFNPSASGVRSATVSIVSNDADNGDGIENPFTFTIHGTGSAGWTIETVVSTGVNENTSIVVNPDDPQQVVIAYYDYTNGDLKYTYNPSGSWNTNTIDSTGDVGTYLSMALDFTLNGHISYYDATNTNLKYATLNAPGSWLIQTIDSVGDVGRYTSIGVDSNNKVHISYFDQTNTDLKYATNVSGSWLTQTIDSVGYEWSSLAIDSNNKVHISYYDYTNRDLKYITNASGSWVAQTIDSAGEVGLRSSIAIDSNNKAHISYYDDTNGELKYATNVSGSWIIEIVDSDGRVGDDNSIAMDSNNKVHISYLDLGHSGGNLKYATNVSGTWVAETVDSAEIVGFKSSIAIDTNNNVHISYLGFGGALKYARQQ